MEIQRMDQRILTLGNPGFQVHSGKGQVAAGFVGAYDSIPNLVHVYEPARCTLSAYAGNPLVRLRRASDDAERDFSHVSASDPELDLAAIAAWAGGDSYIVTPYDQMGGDDLTQATKADQPLFVANIQNGHAGGRLDGSNHYLRGAFTVGGALSQPFSTYVVAALDAASVDAGAKWLTSGADIATYILHGQRAQGVADTWEIYAGVYIGGGASDSNWNVWAGLFNGASSRLWLNAVAETPVANAGAQNADGLTVGGSATGTNLWDGDWTMFAVADPSHDDTARGNMQTAINAYWGVY